MKIIYNTIIPFGYAKYINLFGVIFTKSKNLVLKEDVENHENIHTFQMKWLLYIFFYIIYFIEWLVKIPVSIFSNRGRFGILQYAYRSISFEQEAYYNEDNLDYLKTAKPYSWIKYIFKMYKI